MKIPQPWDWWVNPRTDVVRLNSCAAWGLRSRACQCARVSAACAARVRWYQRYRASPWFRPPCWPVDTISVICSVNVCFNCAIWAGAVFGDTMRIRWWACWRATRIRRAGSVTVELPACLMELAEPSRESNTILVAGPSRTSHELFPSDPRRTPTAVPA